MIAFVGDGGAVFCAPCGSGRIDGLHRDYEVMVADPDPVPVACATALSCWDCGAPGDDTTAVAA